MKKARGSVTKAVAEVLHVEPLAPTAPAGPTTLSSATQLRFAEDKPVLHSAVQRLNLGVRSRKMVEPAYVPVVMALIDGKGNIQRYDKE